MERQVGTFSGHLTEVERAAGLFDQLQRQATAIGHDMTFRDALAAWTRQYLERRLALHGGRAAVAARSLDLPPTTLYRYLARCGLTPSGAWRRGKT